MTKPESLQLYRTLAENFPNGAVLLFDGDLRYQLADGKGLVESGISKQQVEGKTIWEAFTPEICALIEPLYRAALRGESRVSEVPIEGGRIYEVHVSPVRDQNGEIVLGLVMTQDISVRKRAEEALAASERRFSTAFNSNPVLATISALESGVFLAVNDQFVTTTGYLREETVGHTALELKLWPNQVDRKSVMERLAKDGRVRDHEAHMRLKNGDELVLLLSIEKIELDGQTCLIHSANDITLRKKAEEALAASEERYRTLFETAPDAVGVIDASLRLVMANHQGTKLYGYDSLDEAIGLNARDFIAESEWPRIEPFLREVSESKRSMTFEHVGVKKDGTHFNVESRISRLHGENEPPSFLIVSLDITERKRAENQLRASQEQLRALSARIQSAREEEGTRIAREIHDELGGALTGLKWDLEGLAGVLAETDGISKEARERIHSMTCLIEGTIDTVRRISSELRPGVLDDLGLIAALEWQAQQFQSRTGIEYHALTNLESVELNRESATAVFRIFQEILTNVSRHSQATAIQVEQREDGDCFELKVTDNGRGITNEENSNTTSLGLLGMRERALLVGGEVSIEGGKEGTTVIVHVPLARAQSKTSC
jgi:PAS domain S-box-containing protein